MDKTRKNDWNESNFVVDKLVINGKVVSQNPEKKKQGKEPKKPKK